MARRASSAQPKGSVKRLPKRLYFASKISDYQFKKVLWFFACDEPARNVSEKMNLSENSINAINQKLRVFFTDVGLFQDLYDGLPLDDIDNSPNPEFEVRLLEYHLKRVSARRGIKTEYQGIDYHLNESYWRFNYQMVAAGRNADSVPKMMYRHLLTLVKLCGPVGGEIHNRDEAAAVIRGQLDEIAAWLERNSPRFRDPDARSQLQEIRKL